MIVNNGRFVAYSPAERFEQFVCRLSPSERDEVRAFVSDLELSPYLEAGIRDKDKSFVDRINSAFAELREEVEVPSLPRAGLSHWKQSKPNFDSFLVVEQLTLF